MSIRQMSQPRPAPDATASADPTPREFVGVDGLRLRADVWGDPSAAPVVFWHGGGQTRHAWGSAAAAVASRGWYAVTVDLRGHGESAWDASADYSPAAMAGDVVQVAEALGRPVVTVGASMGGLMSLLAAGELRPAAFRALVLVDVAPRIEAEGVQRILQFMTANPEGFADLDEAADAIARYRPHRPRPSDLTGLRKNLRQRDDGRWVWHWDPRIIDPSVSATRRNLDRLTAAARAVQIPTLLVRGRESDVVSAAGVREFLDIVPHATFVDVGDAGHMVAGDRNDAFAAATIAFLDELRR